MTRDEFRPEAVDVQTDALRVLRGNAARLGVKRRVVYGLALEYAAKHEDAFLAYARDEVSNADSTQRPTDKHD